MAKVRYVGPFDAVEVAGLGAFKSGQERDVDDLLAASLLAQESNFAPADDEAENLLARLKRVEPDDEPLEVLTVVQLRDLAAERDINLHGVDKKADIIAAIEAADDNPEGA